ncbi:SDR family NAD(P)-dependent oxidoreductase [Roseibium marinum]|uniref:NADP-dependent 3-hydroxy acid dehydrogenase YdfG n=1 Tax=Roseibium marinum TaxID=281252 RepID=A0A2S3UNL4_9HYPH|nr:SDR family NAD(P)-dependent oxidoreductase [Roseibium marinum]POF29308.1 NADP-dependent 3-hydroxy acid dehydrogenase YdfG [Roseibium marinum]
MYAKSYVASPEDGCAWVTGASSGIGRALALDLARDGWRVAATARSGDALEELGSLSGELPGEIHAFPADITDTRQMVDICGSIVRKFGNLALVIANAGIYLPQDGLNGKAEDYRSSFDVNLMGTVNTLLPAIDAMKSQGRGQIAVVSSAAGYRGLPTAAAYGATKAGLSNLAEALKFDLDGAGIRIQLVSPGFVDTPATRSNPFPMPYLVSVEDAVEQIRKGLVHPRKFEIAFPKAFVRQLKLLRILPYGWYFPLVARATGWNRKRAGN